MDKLDELIQEALEADDRALIDETGEQGYFTLALGIFTGKTGWVSWVVMLVQAGLFLVGFWCAWRFFAATELLAALKWGLSGAVLLLMAGLLKMSLMPVMQANRVIREVKRLELLLASGAGAKKR